MTNEWNTARNTSKGWPLFLDAVQIEGLRGWNGESIEFRFPVVAIAGENSAGKSTILKAAAAAYTAEQSGGYTFYPDDFFPNTPWETVQGVTLTYQIRRGSKIDTQTLRKLTSRWRGMPDRFTRPLFFLDISRTQPVNTQIGYGKAATKANFTAAVTPFSDADRTLLSRIMNRPYTASGMATYQNKQIGVLNTGAGEYSNFHQGAGEDATADLVDLLRAAPDRSLIIIDEVEASLHPRAQRRLMAELFQIAEKRRMQFILSTHSATIMEQLPTERALSPFLVAASSGLGEEALAEETSEAGAGDVDGCLVGGQVEEFVQLTSTERLVGVLVEGVHDGLVGGVRLRRFAFASCGRRELGDDLPGSGQVREPRFGLGQSGGQLRDVSA
ncbi:ATP-dependent nuclease [Streptomyces koyangensis]|uniref:ATP-dependent nuclease n=1 Tax=Streptomyces koyangensis TaxID=188770 RepID=UPI0013C4DD84|nr:AAA family ATPase [Streptomyces koyangensis]